MSDLLIAIGLFAFVILFVYAMVSTGRKQERAKREAFQDFALHAGHRYREEDDGSAQEFARDLDGIGRFKSSSLGDVIPKDVVTGRRDGRSLVLFRHSTRFSQGHTHEWFVAGIHTDELDVERCAIQFFERRVNKGSQYLVDDIVEVQSAEGLQVAVRAPDRASAGAVVEPEVLARVARGARALPFLPEIQIRANRVAVYNASRNSTVRSKETLSALARYASDVARVCRGRPKRPIPEFLLAGERVVPGRPFTG